MFRLACTKLRFQNEGAVSNNRLAWPQSVKDFNPAIAA